MVPKTLLLVAAFCAVTLAGCTAGNDNGGSTSTSTSGGAGAGGCVSGPAGGLCANTTASASGSASASSTTSSSTSTNSSAPAPATASVLLKGQKFVNDTVTIRAGGSVTWSHDDGTMQHTVTANDGSFDSHPSCNAPVLPISDCMNQGETYSQTFATPGTFEYHCKVHSGMTGKVIVVA